MKLSGMGLVFILEMILTATYERRKRYGIL